MTGAHPKILERLAETNLVTEPGYGFDSFTLSAKEKIRRECGIPGAEVVFVSGGTQANLVVISTMLESFCGVISPATGHIAGHEAGAIEYSGHKVISVPSKLGKIDAEDVEKIMSDFEGDENREHIVRPGMLYVTQPTEYGTLYSKSELERLYVVCRERSLVMYIDGARLAYALGSHLNDATMADVAKNCDVFYIGGTKAGALCGEAIVFTKNNIPSHYLSRIKQRGALLAKGRLFGVQFDALFTDGLYYEIGRHAVDMAEKLKDVMRRKSIEFFIETPTNQQFVVMDDTKIEELSRKVGFGFWERAGNGRTVVRFATGWSTEQTDLAYLEDCL